MLTIDAVDPHDTAALREWRAVVGTARAFDRPYQPPPSWAAHRARLTVPWPGERERAWLARVDGVAVGVAVLTLPHRENTENADAEIDVVPLHRRRGIGTRLLALLTAEARSARRVRLGLEAHAPLDGPSPGSAFAVAIGAREALVEVGRRMHLDDGADGNRAHLEQHVAALSPGYELVRWHAGTPAEWADDMARLTARMSTDAPNGDLHLAPSVYDAQRVRDRDALCRGRGIGLAVTAARAPDGRLAAFTEMATEAEQDHHADNWFTLVHPEHRGRRLGLRVKLANLTFARGLHPDLRTIDTYNAEANAPMIMINEAMGFRPIDLLREYELDLPSRS